MMKRTKLAAAMPLLIGLSSVQAAEIYNKDGNKLDLIGKINVSHLFSEDNNNNGDTSSYARFGFKGETKITDQLTGYGFWQYQYSLRNSEGSHAQLGQLLRHYSAAAQHHNRQRQPDSYGHLIILSARSGRQGGG